MVTQWGLTCGKGDLVTEVSLRWPHLSKDDREAVPDAWLLTVPRTVLDQVLQDLGKTLARAFSDRRGCASRRVSRVPQVDVCDFRSPAGGGIKTWSSGPPGPARTVRPGPGPVAVS